MNAQLHHDLSKNLQAKIADVLIRETSIARQFLDLPGVMLLMIEASVMMVRTTAGTVANSIEDLTAAEKIIGETIDAIIDQVRKSQPDIVAKVTAEIQRRQAA